MPVKTELERLAIMETKINNVEITVDRIESKLDKVIDCKADKKEVELLRKEMITINKAQDKVRSTLMNWWGTNWIHLVYIGGLALIGFMHFKGGP